MAFSPIGRRRLLRRNDHGPATVSHRVDSRLPRRIAIAITETRYILSKQFSEAIWALRTELLGDLRAAIQQEQDTRRHRERGLSRLLQEHTSQIDALADRIAALEGDPGPDVDEAGPARLHIVPAPRATGAREAS